MRNLEKYKGVIPAFYACYDNEGNVSPEGVQSLTKYFVEKGVKGVYVNGSSGECIYQSVEDRKIILENVMKAAEGKLTVIAHVACNNTKDSQELARHAESLGFDAIAAIPPIYFHLPEYAIAQYWNDISAAAPNTDFVIYNIPQLAGVALTQGLFAEMRKNPNVIGVKNSSMPVQDIQMFKQAAGPDYIIFNGPDFIELPMPSEKNISADTENVSDSIPAIRIKTKEGVSFEVFSNVSTEVLKYLIEVVIHAE